jgi:hypothetical protein
METYPRNSEASKSFAGWMVDLRRSPLCFDHAES